MTSFEFFLHTAELLLIWTAFFITTMVSLNIKRIEASVARTKELEHRVDELNQRVHDIEGDCQ